MRKVFAVLLTTICLFSVSAEASIRSIYDNSQNAALYHTSKKVMYMSKVNMLEIDKTARADGSGEFLIQIIFNGIGVSKYKIADYAHVDIDGIKHDIKKIIIPRIGEKPRKGRVYAYYSVTKEVEKYIQNYNEYCWFTFYIEGKKPTTIKMSPKEQEEVRLIAKLGYDDFDAFSKGEIKPNSPKQK